MSEKPVPVSIHERRVGDVTVFAITDDVRDGHNIPTLGHLTTELSSRVGNLLDEGCRFFLLDCRDLLYLDADGVEDLIRASIAAGSQGGAIGLVNVRDRLRGFLQIVDPRPPVFTVYDSEQEALTNISKTTGQSEEP